MEKNHKVQGYKFDGWYLDCVAQTLTTPEQKQLTLTPKLYQFLHYFLQHPQQLQSISTLKQNVWLDTTLTDTLIYQSVMSLRKLLSLNNKPQTFLTTLSKRGYIWNVSPVEVLFEEKHNTIFSIKPYALYSFVLFILLAVVVSIILSFLFIPMESEKQVIIFLEKKAPPQQEKILTQIANTLTSNHQRNYHQHLNAKHLQQKIDNGEFSDHQYLLVALEHPTITALLIHGVTGRIVQLYDNRALKAMDELRPLTQINLVTNRYNHQQTNAKKAPYQVAMQQTLSRIYSDFMHSEQSAVAQLTALKRSLAENHNIPEPQKNASLLLSDAFALYYQLQPVDTRQLLKQLNQQLSQNSHLPALQESILILLLEHELFPWIDLPLAQNNMNRASYWLGLKHWMQANYQEAKSHFFQAVEKESFPDAMLFLLFSQKLTQQYLLNDKAFTLAHHYQDIPYIAYITGIMLVDKEALPELNAFYSSLFTLHGCDHPATLHLAMLNGQYGNIDWLDSWMVNSSRLGENYWPDKFNTLLFSARYSNKQKEVLTEVSKTIHLLQQNFHVSPLPRH